MLSRAARHQQSGTSGSGVDYRSTVSRLTITVRLLPWLLLAACSASAPAPRPSPPEPVMRPALAPAPVPRADLYDADEALKDVLSGTLEYVGTGRWPGVDRSYSCAFRNERVVVVSSYCGRKDVQAFRIDIYSPGRGRVRLYAESSGPISKRDRERYFSFVAATEPPPGPGAPVGSLGLTMTFDELRGYEQKRYDAYLPACYAGEQNERPIQGCLGPLAPQAAPFAARHREFLAHASSDWYRVVGIMRELATRYGKDPR